MDTGIPVSVTLEYSHDVRYYLCRLAAVTPSMEEPVYECSWWSIDQKAMFEMVSQSLRGFAEDVTEHGRELKLTSFRIVVTDAIDRKHETEVPKEVVDTILKGPAGLLQHFAPKKVVYDFTKEKTLVGGNLLREVFCDKLSLHKHGDNLYDCPFCPKVASVGLDKELLCSSCNKTIKVQVSPREATVLVEDLLATPAKSFYFPKAWNTSESYPHISREEVQTALQAWKEIQ